MFAQLTIVVDNKPGALAKVASLLGSKKVNIAAVLGEVYQEVGVIRLVLEKGALAKRLLERSGYRVTSSSDVFILNLSNRPGALANLTKKLASQGVNITNLYGACKDRWSGDIVFTVNKPAVAKKALKGLI